MPRKKIPKEEFFKRCFDKHGNKYDYSNSKYIGMSKKIKIYCPKHNIHFFQYAYDHGSGKTGCVECIKIGLSTNIHNRCKDIQKKGYSTNVLCQKNYTDFNDGVIAEYFYHNEFKAYKINVPIEFDGKHECFSMLIKNSIINRLQSNDL